MKRSVEPGYFWIMPSAVGFVNAVLRELGESAVCVVDSSTHIPPQFIVGGISERLPSRRAGAVATFEIDGTTKPIDLLADYFNTPHMSISDFGSQSDIPVTTVFFIAKNRTALVQAVGFCQQVYMSSQDPSPLKTVIINPGEEHHNTEHPFREVDFNASLTKEEVEAYLLLRMTDSKIKDPGGVYRCLVAELAAFDPFFAEDLLAVGAVSLIRDPLGVLRDEMLKDTYRCQRRRVSTGMRPTVDTSRSVHSLHEIYLVENTTGISKVDARKNLDRYIWSAFIASLWPWFEKQRIYVLAIFEEDLAKLTDSEGLIEVGDPKRGFRERRKPEDLEYGNLWGLFKNGQIQEPPAGTKKAQALKIINAIRDIRNELAHQRIPRPNQILEVIRDLPELMYVSHGVVI